MSPRRVEACDSWRPPPRSHGVPSVALLRAGPRLPAFASLSVREGASGEAVKAVVEGAVAVVEVKAKEERAATGGQTEKAKGNDRRLPPAAQLVHHPLTLLALVPNSAALFAAGAAAGAVAKTLTAPLDRVKLLMQVRRARIVPCSGYRQCWLIGC
jgi:solute carrier family 25 (mitochondrial phosphate transporter), member 23/24/25/41